MTRGHKQAEVRFKGETNQKGLGTTGLVHTEIKIHSETATALFIVREKTFLQAIPNFLHLFSKRIATLEIDQ